MDLAAWIAIAGSIVVTALLAKYWSWSDSAKPPDEKIPEECAVSTRLISFDEVVALLNPAPCRKRLIILCGAPGSGKSRYAKALVALGYVRLSLDKIWEEEPMMRIYPELLEKEFQQKLAAAFASKANIVDDNLNCTKLVRHEAIVRARRAGYTDIVIVHIDTSLEVCLAQNPDRQHSVPDWKVKQVWERFQGGGRPHPQEGAFIRIRPGEGDLKYCELFL